jgi:hypothetical protein
MKTWRSGYLEANLWRYAHSFSPFSAMDRILGVGVVILLSSSDDAVGLTLVLDLFSILYILVSRMLCIY